MGASGQRSPHQSWRSTADHRRRAVTSVLLTLVALSGMQCLSDLIVKPPVSDLQFSLTQYLDTIVSGDIRRPHFQGKLQGGTDEIPDVGGPITLDFVQLADTLIVRVDSAGNLVGKARGQAVLRVRPRDLTLPVDTLHDTVRVWVVAHSIDMAPARDTTLYSLNETLRLRAWPCDKNDDSIAGTVTWTPVSGVPQFVDTLSDGRLIARANGEAVFRATIDTVSATRKVKVTQRATTLVNSRDTLRFRAVGRDSTLGATLRDALSNTIATLTPVWSSENSSVATVPPSGGKVTARGAGTTRIISTYRDDALGVNLAAYTTVQVLPAQLRVVKGNGQTDTVGTPLDTALEVELFDGTNRVLDAGDTVVFKVTSGGGSFGTSDSAIVLTDAQGRASARPTLGTGVGAHTFRVTGRGLTGSAVTYTAMATAGPAYRIRADSGAAQSDTVAATLARAFWITVVDQYGNTVSGHPVTFQVRNQASRKWARVTGASQATGVPQFTVATDAQGVAWARLRLDTLRGTDTVEVTSSGPGGAPLADSPLRFTAGASAGTARRLGFVRQPTSIAAGRSFDTLRVEVRDTFGNRAPTALPAVTLALRGATGAVLSGTNTAVADTGVATFRELNLTIDRAGSGYRLVATATGLRSDTSTAFDVTWGAANRIAFRVQPSTARADQPIAPIIEVVVLDASGNLVEDDNSTVVLTVAPGPGGSTEIIGFADAPVVDGVAAFTGFGLHRAARDYQLRATRTGLTPVVSVKFNVRGAPAALVADSGDGQQGIVSSTLLRDLVVQVRDANGDGVPHDSVVFAVTAGGGTVGGATTDTVVTDALGRARATFTLGSAAGTNTVTARSLSLTGQSVTFTATAVVPGLHFHFLTPPGAVNVLAPFSPPLQAELRDTSDNLVTGLSVSVTLTLSGGTGTLTGTTTTSTVAGVATFAGVAVSRAGTGYRVTASATGVTPVTSSAFDVRSVPATLTKTGGDNQSGLVGSLLDSAFVATVRDAAGDPVAGDSVIFKVTSGGGTFGTLDSAIAITDAQGRATAQLRLGSTEGTVAVSARSKRLVGASVTFSASASSGGLQLEFVTQPSAVAAGAAMSPSVQVRVRDLTGTTATSASTIVTLALMSGTSGAQIVGTASVAATSGVATFANVKVDLVGTGYRLEARATGLVPDTSGTFDVRAGSASRLVLVSEPSSATAGAAFVVRVELRDAYGNLVTAATDSVFVALVPASGTAQASLRGTKRLAAAAGIGQFEGLSIDSAGTQYLLAVSGTGLVADTTAPFAVAPAPAVRLVFAAGGTPRDTTAGSTLRAVVVLEQDSLGNTVTSAVKTVTLALGAGSPSGATLLGTASAATTDGAATFNTVRIRLAGTGYTLVASAEGLTSATSAAFAVTPAPAARLAFSVQPRDTVPSATIGGSGGVRVAVQDSVGNVIPTATTAVTLAITAGTGTTGAVLTGGGAVNAVGGVATFSGLSIDRAGNNYTLTASASGFTAALSAGFSILAATDRRLVFTAAPTSATAGAAFSPSVQVAVKDGSGNTVTSATDQITLAITAPGGISASLRGTKTVAAVAGVATFPGLSIDSAGTGYTITATATGIASGTSAAFAVVPAPPARLVFLVQPSSRTAGNVFSPAIQVAVRDSLWNLAATPVSVTLAITAGTGASGATLAGTWTVLSVNGVATFADLGITKAGTGYSLTATATGVTPAPTPAVSTTFSITAGLVAAVTVSPSGASLSGAGTTQAFTATALDALGNVIGGAAFTWASLNPAVATVNTATGQVTAVASGQATVSATVGGVTGYALVTVAVPGVAPVNLWVQTASGTTEYLRGVWGSSATDVFAVGDQGTALRFDGHTWSRMSGQTGVQGGAVWGTSSSDVFTVGGTGTMPSGAVISHFDGATWTQRTVWTTGVLFGVWGASARDVFAVGDGGAIYRFDGSNWTLTQGGWRRLNAVWGTSSRDVFAVGFDGVIVHYDGSTWSAMTSGTSEPLTGVWGTSSSNVYATGTFSYGSGGFVLRYDGATWTQVATAPAGFWSGIWGTSASDVYAGAQNSTIYRFDGSALSASASGLPVIPLGMWGTSAHQVYAVGTGGVVLQGLRGATVSVTPARPTLASVGATVQLAAAAKDAAGTAVAGAVTFTWTSSDSTKARVDANGLVTAMAGGAAVIRATAPGGAYGEDTITVTQAARTVTVTPAGTSLTGVGATTTLAAVVRDSLNIVIPGASVAWTSLNPSVATVDPATGAVTAVGAGQVTVAATSGARTGCVLLTVATPGLAPVNLWVPQASGTSETLHDVWGTSKSNVYAVGASATVLRYNGSAWQPVTVPTTEWLSGIAGVADTSVYAVGGPNGVVLRFGGTSWSALAATFSGAHRGAWARSPREVYVLGATADGYLARFDGTAWQVLATGSGDPVLTSLWGFADLTYAVGERGVSLRCGQTSCEALASGTANNLNDVWGTYAGPNLRLFAVGDNGTIRSYDGSTWNVMTSPTTGFLNGVAGTSVTDVYSVGSAGTILRYDGANWTSQSSGIAVGLTDVWASPDSAIFAVGDGGTILRGYRGATVSCIPASVTLTSIGATQQLTCAARDALGYDVASVALAYTSGNAGVAAVDAGGLVTSIASGATTVIVAAPGGVADTVAVAVGQVPARVEVTPAGISLTGVGATHRFTATVYDSAGQAIPDYAVTWSVLNTNVARAVDASSGDIAAVSAGQATVAATAAGGVVGYGLVTVAVDGAAPNLFASATSGTTQRLYMVWGTSPTSVFAVGGGGTILRYDGTNWTALASGTSQNLYSVWGTSPANVFAAGEGGTILRYDGASWATMTSGTTASLFEVWGTSPTDVFAVGASRTILHWDGTTWTALGSGPSVPLAGAWGTSPTDVFAVGHGNTILRWDGTTWTALASGTEQGWRGVWGTSPTNVFVVGFNETIMHWDGTGWTLQASLTWPTLEGVWGTSPTNVLAVGENGTVLRYDGTNWATLTSGTTENLVGVWGTGPTNVFVVGGNGTILRGFAGATVTVTPATPTLTALGATLQLTATAKDASNNSVTGVTGWTWSSATPSVATVDPATGVVTAVASGTAVITATAPGGASGSTTVSVSQLAKTVTVTPYGAGLSGVGATQPFTAEVRDSLGVVIAGASVAWSSLNPQIVGITPDGVASGSRSGQATIRATSGTAVGYALVTVSVPGATPVNLWQLRTTSTSLPFWSAWGASATQLFAGAAGGIHGFDGSSWSGMSGVPTDFTARGIWGTSPSDVWAVGTGARVYRYDGSNWSAVTGFPGTTDTLASVWAAAPNDVYVGAFYGKIYRYDGAAWTKVLDVGSATTFYSIWGYSAREVYAAGYGGVVYRYDGTQWTPMTSGTTASIQAIWGDAPGRLLGVATATGQPTTALRLEGGTWTATTTTITGQIFGLWGSSVTDVYAGVYSATPFTRYDGLSWALMPGQPATQYQMAEVWGTSDGDVWVLGVSGRAYRGVRGATVAVTPATPTLTALGATRQLAAEARTPGGAAVTGVTFTWTSSDTTKVRVSAAGLVTAVANGAATITATAPGGASGSTVVTVSQAAKAVEVTLAGASLNGAGATATLAAVARDSLGNAIPDASVTWASLNPNVATVSAAGVVTAVGPPGQVTILASFGGVTAYALATVTIAQAPVNLWAQQPSGTTAKLWGTWGTSARNVFAAGASGTIRRSDGTSWAGMSSGITATLAALWGSSPSDVYAVGWGGYIRRYNGTSWAGMSSTTPLALYAVWGSGPTDVHAVGQSGTALRSNGTSWTSIPSSTTINLNGMWGTSASDVYAVGGSGVILHFDGSTWSGMPSPATNALQAVWGTSSADVYAVGDAGQIFRYAGATWAPMTSGTANHLYGVWGSGASDVYAVGASGTILRYDGSSWQAMTSGVSGALEGVWGGSGDSVYVVGDAGVILRGYRGATVTVTPPTPTITALGATQPMAATAKDALSRVLSGVTYTWTSGNPAVATVNPGTGVVTAVAVGAATITATAPGGASGSTTVTVSQTAKTVTVTTAGASLSGPGASTPLAALARDSLGSEIPGASVTWSSLNLNVATVDASSGQVSAVAAGQVTIAATVAGATTGYGLVTVSVPGLVPVNLWAPMTSGTTARLNGVWSTPGSDVFAVGDGGTILRYNGTAWSPMASGTSRALKSVWGVSASDAYAVGYDGAFVRYNGTSWSLTPQNVENAAGVWGSSASDVWVVGSFSGWLPMGGDYGRIFRFDGSSWTTWGTGGSAVWGSSRSSVYAVGGSGTIVRFDGSAWSPMSSGTGASLSGIWGLSDSDIFAVGSEGQVLRYTGANWAGMTSGTSQALAGVWGTSSGDVYAVGAAGTILRFDGGTWSPMTSGTGTYLRSVAGGPSGEVIAVGDAGTILRGLRGATVACAPSLDTLRTLGATRQLACTAKDASNNTVSGLTYTWTSSDTTRVRVSATGLVTAVGAGTATITATAPGGAAGTATIVVRQAANVVVVTPSSAPINYVGGTALLTGIATDASGAPISGATFTWTSLNTNIATVLPGPSATAQATAVANGTVGIVATAGSVADTAFVTVRQVAKTVAVTPVNPTLNFIGATRQLTADPRDSANSAMAGVAWTSDAPSVATVSATGLIAAVANGQTIIRARPDSGAVGPDTVRVQQVAKTVVATPASIALTAVGATRQISVAATDSADVAVNGVTYTWSSSDSAKVTISPAGLVTAVAPTTTPANLIVTAPGGAADTVLVTVTQVVASIVVSPAGATITAPAGNQTFTATVKDSLGNAIPGATVTWASLNANVATANASTGQAAPVASGQATISATVGGVMGYALATVAIPGATPVNLWVLRAAPLSNVAFIGVWGTSATDIFAAGFDTPGGPSAGGHVIHYDGTTWTEVMSTGAGRALEYVWGSSATDVYAPGDAGTLLHYNGTSWATVDLGTSQGLQGVWGSSPNDVYVAGSNNSLFHFNGTAWSQATLPTSGQTAYLWGSSAAQVYVIAEGTSGTVLSYDGISWSAVQTPTTQQLKWIWGTSPSDVYAVGLGGAVLHYDGNSWTLMASPTTQNLIGVWGSSSSDIYATDISGTVFRFDGATWKSVAVNPPGAVAEIWGTSGGDVFAVGAGTILRGVRGATVTATPASLTFTALNATRQLSATAQDAASNPISGVTFTWTSSAPSVATVSSSGLVTAVSVGSANIIITAPGGAADTVAVTVTQVPKIIAISPAGATITTQGGTQSYTATVKDSLGAAIPGSTVTWSSLNTSVATVPTGPSASATVTAVTSGQTTIAAAASGLTGYAVVTVAIPGAAAVNLWASPSPGTTRNLARAWGASDSDVWVVGDSGEVRRYNGTTWSAVSGGGWGINALRGIGGTSSSDVFVTGQPNSVYHWDGSAWTAQSVGYSWLNGVWAASPKDVFVVGLGGRILRYDGTGWTLMTSNTSVQLRSVWGTSANDVFAVGAGGVIVHWNGSAWSPMNSNTEQDIGSVWGTSATEVYAAAANGTRLQYNGTSWSAMPTCTGCTDLSIAGTGTSSQDVYTAGGVSASTQLQRYNGTNWSITPMPATWVWSLSALGGNSGSVFVVGSSGAALRGYRGASVALTPASAMLTAFGATQQLTATASYSGNSNIPNVPWTWTTSNGGIASVAGGLVTAVANGTALIIATAPGGLADTTTITVNVSAATPRIAAGANFSCSLQADGTALCWGDNYYGQLGDGTNTGRAQPTPVAGLLKFQSLAAGGYHACGLTADGAMYCWGQNTTYGALGDGTTADRNSPTPVSGGRTFKAITAGFYHTCAVQASDGAAYCWGADDWGQLGNGASGASSTPSLVSGGLTFSSIDAGDWHTCGTTTTWVYCWGSNEYGQVGDNSPGTNRSSPVATSLNSTWNVVAAGNLHTCALKTSGGNVKCWGRNAEGQVGDGTYTQQNTPASVFGTLVFTSIAAGGRTSCGAISNGSTYCWGSDSTGALGNGGSYINGGTPIYVPGQTFAAIAVGGGHIYGNHACGRTSGGTVYCWGDNTNGQLGIGMPTRTSSSPVAAAGGVTYNEITRTQGRAHVCALLSTGYAVCWGDNYYGQLGNGTNDPSTTPVVVSGGRTYTYIWAGADHTCALMSTGTAYCWGRGTEGQLGNNAQSNSNVPVLVVTQTFYGLSLGGNHSCGFVGGNVVYCWGDNTYGQVGNGTSGNFKKSPTLVSGNWNGVFAGYDHTCATRWPSNRLYCWGNNTDGQIGRGVLGDSAIVSPDSVRSTLTWLDATGGYRFTCARASDKSAFCWGRNEVGQLGRGDTTRASTPQAVMPNVTPDVLSAGYQNVCATTTSGSGTWCWGDNSQGLLGGGVGAYSATPVSLFSGTSWQMIWVGTGYACGRQMSTYIYCWGDNAYGVFGAGWSGFRLVPVAVTGGYTFLTPPIALAPPPAGAVPYGTTPR